MAILFPHKIPPPPVDLACGLSSGAKLLALPVKQAAVQAAVHYPKYKTSMCFFFKKGRCQNGNDCRFAHGLAELKKHQSGFLQKFPKKTGDSVLAHQAVGGIVSSPPHLTCIAFIPIRRLIPPPLPPPCTLPKFDKRQPLAPQIIKSTKCSSPVLPLYSPSRSAAIRDLFITGIPDTDVGHPGFQVSSGELRYPSPSGERFSKMECCFSIPSTPSIEALYLSKGVLSQNASNKFHGSCDTARTELVSSAGRQMFLANSGSCCAYLATPSLAELSAAPAELRFSSETLMSTSPYIKDSSGRVVEKGGGAKSSEIVLNTSTPWSPLKPHSRHHGMVMHGHYDCTAIESEAGNRLEEEPFHFAENNTICTYQDPYRYQSYCRSTYLKEPAHWVTQRTEIFEEKPNLSVPSTKPATPANTPHVVFSAPLRDLATPAPKQSFWKQLHLAALDEPHSTFDVNKKAGYEVNCSDELSGISRMQRLGMSAAKSQLLGFICTNVEDTARYRVGYYPHLPVEERQEAETLANQFNYLDALMVLNHATIPQELSELVYSSNACPWNNDYD